MTIGDVSSTAPSVRFAVYLDQDAPAGAAIIARGIEVITAQYDTVDVYGSDAPAPKLELVDTIDEPPRSVTGQQLEAAIPSRGSGSFNDLPPPSTAKADLRAHFGSTRPDAPAVVTNPEVLLRPAADVTRPVAQVIAQKPLAEETFVSLLDASLKLGS
jgi:hypothetical protein